jgi:DNA repair exonuclease SbcCD ATPase subunit
MRPQRAAGRSTGHPRPRPHSPEITASKFFEVEDLLARHRSFIEQNSVRLPHFSTSVKAEAQVRELQAKLKSLEAQPTPPHLPLAIDRRLSDLARRYGAITEEDRVIAELRSGAGESAERDTREYSEAAQKVSDAKRRLSLLGKRRDAQNRALKDAEKIVSELGQEVTYRMTQLEQLQSDEGQLRESEQAFRRDLRALEYSLAALVEGDEKNLSQLEIIVENRTATLQVLKRTLSDKRSTVRSKAEKIERLLMDIESTETDIDEAIAVGFMVAPSLEEPDQFSDESASESFLVSDALEVLNMVLLDPNAVTAKIEAITGHWSASPHQP